MDNRTSNLTSMLYFLAGGVTGAVIGFLLAPQSGRSTREMMGRKLRQATDSARELKDRVVLRGEELREEAAYRVDEAASALAGNGPHKERGKEDAVASA